MLNGAHPGWVDHIVSARRSSQIERMWKGRLNAGALAEFFEGGGSEGT